jgi:hypothetical protein
MNQEQYEERKAICRVCEKNKICNTRWTGLLKSQSRCPDGKWNSVPMIRSMVAHQYGDAVASMAQPIAQVIDYAFGTKSQNCGDCAQRQEDWNKKDVAESGDMK